jgi:flavin reductase (DIM6/NTAB) family NADH-FMN oxidoreductase RutF
MIGFEDATGPDGSVDTTALRKVYGRFPTGVTAICALDDEVPVGFAASSFNTVSADPPLVAIAIQNNSTTWPRLAARPRLGLSILAADQGPLCRQLAARTGDRFAGVGWSATEAGAVLIHGAAAWLECSVHDLSAVGDHHLVVLRVMRHRTHDEVPPLVFQASAFHRITALDQLNGAA